MQPAQEGVDRARADGPPAPLVEAVGVDLEASISSTRSSKVRTTLAVDADGPVADRLGLARFRRAVTLWTTIVYCWRSSSASANRNGSSSSAQNSPRVQKNEVTSRWRAATSGLALGSSRAGGAKNATEPNGPGRQAEARVAGGLVVGELGVGVVEEQQVLALDVEDERLGVGRLGAEHARVEQAVEQEGGVGGLGGHAGDPLMLTCAPRVPSRNSRLR